MNEHRKELIRFALLSALFVWAALSYVELGKFMYRGILFARLIDGRPFISDFVNPYNAGLLAAKCISDHQINIWDLNVQNESLEKLIAPIKPEQPFYLQYPPYFWCLMMLESFMPMNMAWIAWNVLGTSLAVFALLKLAEFLNSRTTRSSLGSSDETSRSLDSLSAETPNSSDGLADGTANSSDLTAAMPGTAHGRPLNTVGKNKIYLLIAIIFSSFPAWLTIELGQPTLYLIPAAAAMLLLLGKQRNFLAGICSGILMIKLQYAPFFLLIGLIFGRLKFLLGNISIVVIMLLCSLAILGPSNVFNYPHALLSGETGQTVSGVSAHMMQNLRGELTILFPDSLSLIKISVLIFYAAGITGSGVVLWKAMKRNSTNAFAMSTALSMMIALLSSPHTHTQDYLLLGICAVLLFNVPATTKINDKPARWIRNLLITLAPLSWLLFMLQPLFLMARIQPFFFYLCVITFLLFSALMNELEAISDKRSER